MDGIATLRATFSARPIRTPARSCISVATKPPTVTAHFAAVLPNTMFEALLTIEYLTQEKDKTRPRALAYFYKVEIQRKRFYLSQDPNTAEAKAFRAFIADDPLSSEWKPAGSPNDLAERVKEIDALLDTPEFKEIAEEYKRTKKKRTPNWYSLYDGPKNIAELAQLLKRGAQYEILYREWSERIHSADVIDRILTRTSSGPAARSLRDPAELNSTIDFAITFAIEAARFLIRYYRPAEELLFNKWYRGEISSNWKKSRKSRCGTRLGTLRCLVGREAESRLSGPADLHGVDPPVAFLAHLA
jgi:hypothetical protein